MLVSCSMWPWPCERITGSTARVISAAAKKFTSIWSRNCSGVNSSAAPSEPRPAMFAKTLMRPKRLSVAETAFSREPALVTSSDSASVLSGLLAASCSTASVRRAPIAMQSPRSKATSARARPNPLEAPVMNQVRTIAFLLVNNRRFDAADANWAYFGSVRRRFESEAGNLPTVLAPPSNPIGSTVNCRLQVARLTQPSYVGNDRNLPHAIDGQARIQRDSQRQRTPQTGIVRPGYSGVPETPASYTAACACSTAERSRSATCKQSTHSIQTQR